MGRKYFTPKRNNINSSKLEHKFENLLKTLNLEYETQFQIGTKFFDFYLPTYNTLIEVDGDYWHANPTKFKKEQLNERQKETIVNDALKNNLAKATGRKLLRIWECEINKFPIQVMEKLKKELKQ